MKVVLTIDLGYLGHNRLCIPDTSHTKGESLSLKCLVSITKLLRQIEFYINTLHRIGHL